MEKLVTVLFIAARANSSTVFRQEEPEVTSTLVPIDYPELLDFNELSEKKSSSDDYNDGSDPEKLNSDWVLPQFIQSILPSALTSSAQMEPQNASDLASSKLFSRILPNIIIGRPSVFRLQFYNSELEDGSSKTEDENSTVTPNVVFGSPLCLGLCLPFQIYSENTSVHFLSDKQISFYPPGPTPLSIPDEGNSSQKNSSMSSSESEIGEGSWPPGWFSSWFPIAPSFQTIKNSIQLPHFPRLPTDVSDFIG